VKPTAAGSEVHSEFNTYSEVQNLLKGLFANLEETDYSQQVPEFSDFKVWQI
jgi:hypothetical protein